MTTQTLTELQILEPGISNIAPLTASSRNSHEPTTHSDLEPSTGIAATEPAAGHILSKPRAIAVIAQLLGTIFFSSFCNGAIVVDLPSISTTLPLDPSLVVWPTSVYYLTAGSCLLLAGATADVVGTRRLNLLGCFLSAIFAVAFGLARTGGELIAFRALQGVANAIVVPCSVSIVSRSVEAGRARNMGFACLGFAAPVGFSLGLVLGGVLVDSVGWRPAFYLAGAASFVLFILGIWALPRDPSPRPGESVWKRLGSEVDWVGTILASGGLAIFSYALATLSADISNIHKASTIAMLIIGALLIPIFIGWMHYQVKHGRTALIPNSLWRSSVFTSVCVMVLLTTAVTNCMELYSSLFFQEVQHQSALGASIRIIPSLIAGALTNLSMGIFVNRMPIMWTVLISSTTSAIAPLLMALIRPAWPYWYDAFFAQILAPLSCDILFTVGLLVISDVFPPHMQALSGAVFNTCAQLGTAIGLTLTSLIAASTTASAASPNADKTSPAALMAGYRAVFWTMAAWMAAVCLVCVVGLRKVGAIGVKRD
ncbi:MFS general substrate transporter [Xylariaceae sp. FL0016]|nr:MFS general substrate transporter [Xylariaceae sp. FL0016]